MITNNNNNNNNNNLNNIHFIQLKTNNKLKIVYSYINKINKTIGIKHRELIYLTNRITTHQVLLTSEENKIVNDFNDDIDEYINKKQQCDIEINLNLNQLKTINKQIKHATFIHGNITTVSSLLIYFDHKTNIETIKRLNKMRIECIMLLKQQQNNQQYINEVIKSLQRKRDYHQNYLNVSINNINKIKLINNNYNIEQCDVGKQKTIIENMKIDLLKLKSKGEQILKQCEQYEYYKNNGIDLIVGINNNYNDFNLSFLNLNLNK